MAQRTEAPDRLQAIDDLDNVTIEDGDADGAAPVEGEGQETPGDDPEAPAEGGELEEDAAGDVTQPAEQPPKQPQTHPQQWKPPAGGTPFRFRADHREVEVPGALEWDHGIYVPKDAWNGVVSRHLADRDSLYQQHQREVQTLQQQLQDRDPDRNPVVQQANITVQKFRELMDQGPAAVAQWLDNFAVNRPLLEAEIKAAGLEAQLQARQQQMGSQEEEAAITRIQQELPGYVEQNIAALISQTPELASLKGSEKALVQSLWPYARSFLWEADRDYPEHQVARGQIVPRVEVLSQLLKQEADRRAEVAKLQKAAAHNQRALGRNSPTRTVPARGRPVPGPAQREYKVGEAQKAKDDYLAWDPSTED